MSYGRGYWVLLITFVLCSVIILPVIPFFLFKGEIPLLGRIAVLPEARGKRRMIGITD
jgi:hypothetical protein